MTTIHVNDNIAENKRHGTRLPPIEIVREGGIRESAHRVMILGPSEFVYRPDAPYPDTNWTLWIQTDAPVMGFIDP